MRNPSKEQSDGVRAQKAALDFGLTERALTFARVYAESPAARSPTPRGRPVSATVPGARAADFWK